MRKHFDVALPIIITFLLFIMALVAKGFSDELLLGAGLSLVSLKLIMMAHMNRAHVRGRLGKSRKIKEERFSKFQNVLTRVIWLCAMSCCFLVSNISVHAAQKNDPGVESVTGTKDDKMQSRPWEPPPPPLTILTGFN